jgi:hypothetical protein
MLDRYEREDMLENLVAATSKHTGVRKPVEWICDCGCDIAQWYQRTDAGLAFTQQAWPMGVTPYVIVMETRDEVERFVGGTVASMRQKRVGSVETIEERIRRFEKAVWSAWADA